MRWFGVEILPLFDHGFAVWKTFILPLWDPGVRKSDWFHTYEGGVRKKKELGVYVKGVREKTAIKHDGFVV